MLKRPRCLRGYFCEDGVGERPSTRSSLLAARERARLAISVPWPSARPKRGHDVSLLHAIAWDQRHISQTAGDPELKYNLKFDAARAPGTKCFWGWVFWLTYLVF